MRFKAAAAEAKAAAENAPVHLKMTLGLDFSMTGSEGSDKREKFKRDVAQDLSSASGLPAANFRIRDVSLILDIQVMPDPLAPGMHLWAAKYLGEQAAGMVRWLGHRWTISGQCDHGIRSSAWIRCHEP